jgi:hypothetical protein
VFRLVHQHHRVPHFAANQQLTGSTALDFDDALFWFSLIWFVALCGAAILVLFPL